jgi:hypothetical protein
MSQHWVLIVLSYATLNYFVTTLRQYRFGLLRVCRENPYLDPETAYR